MNKAESGKLKAESGNSCGQNFACPDCHRAVHFLRLQEQWSATCLTSRPNCKKDSIGIGRTVQDAYEDFMAATTVAQPA